jgi:hypothetical protein
MSTNCGANFEISISSSWNVSLLFIKIQNNFKILK